MSKAIKLDLEVYERLDQLRGKGETFSQVVERLLTIKGKVSELVAVLSGIHHFREWQNKENGG